MARRKFLSYLRDWSFGINNKDAENLISEHSLVDAENAVIGRGFVSKRHGYVRYTLNALTNPITKLYDFYKNNGSREFLSVSDQTLYKDGNGTLSPIAFSGITSLSSSDVRIMTYKDRNINDVVLLADKGKLKRYDGTNVSEVTPHTPTTDEETDPGLNDLANLTNFRTVAIKKDRVFAAAHPTVKNRLSFCHHDPDIGYAVYDYWPAPFFFDFATDENDEIVELKVFRDALIVLCKRSMWVLYGDGRTLQDYEIHKINVPSGCISPNSVQIVGNYLFYLSDDHVYAMYATDQNYISAEIASGPIETTLKSISRTDKEKAVASYYDNKYYLSFPDGTTLVLDTSLPNPFNKYGAWTRWTNLKANSFLERNEGFYFASDTGLIYQFDPNVFNDDGDPIKFVMKTKNMDFGYTVQDKKLRRIWTIAKQYDSQSSAFNLKAIVDYVSINLTDIKTDISGVWDEGNWDEILWDFVDVVQTETRIRERGKNIQLVITNEELDQPLTIYGLVIQYKLKKP